MIELIKYSPFHIDLNKRLKYQRTLISSSSIFSKYNPGSYSPDLYLNSCERENIGAPSKKSSAITQLKKNKFRNPSYD